jgi:hypothetical protein
MIVAVRYGSRPSDNRCGLFIVNDWDIAYDVSIGNVPFGTSKLVFHNADIPRLSKADGEQLCETWIEKAPHDLLLGSGLFHEMVAQKVAQFDFEINYKDASTIRYRTLCSIERDVLAPGGLVVRYLGQEVRTVPKPTKITKEDNVFQFHPIEPGDPQLYVAVHDRWENGLRVTEFSIENHGGSVAHQALLKLLPDTFGSIEFPTVDTLAMGRRALLRPTIKGGSVFGKHNLIPLLSEAWDASGGAKEDFVVLLEVLYWNVNQTNGYSTMACLVYDPLQEELRQSGSNDQQAKEYKVVRIESTRIQRRVQITTD